MEYTAKRAPSEWRALFYSEQFETEFFYGGDDLGAVYSPEKTGFALWAPTAEAVSLRLYKKGSAVEGAEKPFETIEMHKGEKGVWRAEKTGDLDGIYYTFLVTADGQQRETADPYAKAAGVNGRRSMVVDLQKAAPQGWESERTALDEKLREEARGNRTGSTAPVIWEVHVKDFSYDERCGVPEGYRGKYKAFTCENTGLDGNPEKPTCVEWLKWLGVTHVQILPMYDYGSVDEAGEDGQFNWGYDPVNYNVPEGSYSTDAFHGAVRIKECREMIQALHRAGIRVVMDVVFNHTYDTDSCFQRTVPYYFYRQNEDGSWSDGSACGNDTASERRMYRKYIVDSVCFWAKEYHVDGFRFDLMGLHDVETMNLIRRALDELPGGRDIMMYGEPWAAGATAMQPGNVQAVKANAELLDTRIGFFNDDIRDSIKGSVFFPKKAGFVNGKPGMEDKIRSSVLGWCDKKGGYALSSPLQSVSYVSAHDNYTLWDKLVYTQRDIDLTEGDIGEMECSAENLFFTAREERLLSQNRLAAGIYFTCLGTVFLQAGEEGARTKRGEGNSYNLSPRLNRIDWGRMYENRELAEFYRGLILLRKNFAGWQESGLSVMERIHFPGTPEGTAAFEFGDEEGSLFVIYNASDIPQKILLPEGKWQLLTDGRRFKIEEKGRELEALGEREGSVWAEEISVTILRR